MHRLHVAATVGGERGVEAEVVQAGAACDATKLSRVEGAGLALANRCLQSRVLLRGKAAAIVLRFDQADGGASQHRERQDQGRDRATTRHYAARRGEADCGRAQPFWASTAAFISHAPHATPKAQR